MNAAPSNAPGDRAEIRWQVRRRPNVGFGPGDVVLRGLGEYRYGWPTPLRVGGDYGPVTAVDEAGRVCVIRRIEVLRVGIDAALVGRRASVLAVGSPVPDGVRYEARPLAGD